MVWLCHLPAIDLIGSAYWELEEVFDSADKADEWNRSRKATTWIVVREVK
jgi:hypothetical protein